MNVGEVLSSLIKYASDWDKDNLLLLKGIYNIEVRENDDYEIELNFTDGNTRDVIIDKDGNFLRYVS